MRADGKGDHIVFKNERLYVDGKPFLLFAPWGAAGAEHAALCHKYHLTGLFYGPGGPMGQELPFNFMDVQTYLED